MIEITLTASCIRKLKNELEAAGSNEIGGVLAAEQVADGKFVVLDLSVQRTGTYAHFVRDPDQHRMFIQHFHTQMGNRPKRFNYLGEWHSHPSFPALPSIPDLHQMQQLIEDAEQVSSFLILLIIKLEKDGELIGSAHAFRRKMLPIRVQLKANLTDTIREEGIRA